METDGKRWEARSEQSKDCKIDEGGRTRFKHCRPILKPDTLTALSATKLTKTKLVRSLQSSLEKKKRKRNTNVEENREGQRGLRRDQQWPVL